MDRKKIFNLLKNLQNLMRCPACGASYAIDEIQFVGSKDGYMLLSMTCSKCSLPVWINFFANGNQDGQLVGDLTVLDSHLIAREPISCDEVIDFHSFLKKFDGNFKKLFKKK